MNCWSSTTPYNLSHIMTDEKIIEYVVQGKENPIEDETVYLAAVQNEGIGCTGILEEVPEPETQKYSHVYLIKTP